MKKIFSEVKAIREYVCYEDNQVANIILQKAALAYTLTIDAYHHNPGSLQQELHANGKAPLDALGQLHDLIHDADFILNSRGLDFLKSEILTSLDLLLRELSRSVETQDSINCTLRA